MTRVAMAGLAAALVWALGASAVASSSNAHLQLDIAMPEHAVDGDDAYLCTTAALPADARSVVSIAPNADQEVVHHMLLFGADLRAELPRARAVSALAAAGMRDH